MNMDKRKVVNLEDRLPKLKEQRKSRANRRLIIYMSVFFILILFILYTQSSLSNVAKINVEGNEYTSKKEIIKASDLSTHTSFFSVNSDDVSKKIKENTQIKSASIEKAFPNKINIHVKEYDRVAYVADDGKFIPILENGEILKSNQGEDTHGDAPLLVGWNNGERLEEMIKELIKIPDSIAHSISEIEYTPTDVNKMFITLYMNDGFEVTANIEDLSKKILAYPQIVSELGPEAAGVIDFEVYDGLYDPYFKDDKKEDEAEEAQ